MKHKRFYGGLDDISQEFLALEAENARLEDLLMRSRVWVLSATAGYKRSLNGELFGVVDALNHEAARIKREKTRELNEKRPIPKL